MERPTETLSAYVHIDFLQYDDDVYTYTPFFFTSNRIVAFRVEFTLCDSAGSSIRFFNVGLVSQQ
jgi:hypothetical protein